jgi:hypothetical protein
MHPTYLLIAALLAAGLLIASSELRAGEDLTAKRSVCQAEARQRIKPPHNSSVELLQISIGSRQAYVRECMTRAPIDPVSTGALQELIRATAGPSKTAPSRQQ